MRTKDVRTPVQERARRRRETLLDATATLLDRGGWDALTTNAVAREAGAAVGTVYEYFPSREALLQGLLDRHGERLGVAIDAAIAEGGEDWTAIADRAVEVFARFWIEEPGYRAAWSASQVSLLLGATGDRWSDRFTARIDAVIAALRPDLPRRERAVVARTTVHLVSGLLLVAVGGPPRQRRAMIAETQRALRAYLRDRLFG